MENIGKIIVSHDADLVAIAEAAGQSNPDARWYDGGVLYVRGVTDEDLTAAAETLHSPAAQAARLLTARLAELAALRWEKQTAGIVVDGIALRTDRESMVDLRALANRPADRYPLTYKAASGFIPLATPDEAARLADAQDAHVQACFDHEVTLAGVIDDLAGDATALAALDLSEGWPA